MAVGVVVNPVAGGGRMRRRWPGIESVLTRQLGPLDVKQTSGPGEACDLARQLAMDGAELVIAAGGDGTVSEAVDGLMQARAVSGQLADLAIVPVGTGSDLARGLGLVADIDRLAARIAAGEKRTIDVGCVKLCRRRRRAGQPPFHQHRQPRAFRADRPRRQCGQERRLFFRQTGVPVSHRARAAALQVPGRHG